VTEIGKEGTIVGNEAWIDGEPVFDLEAGVTVLDAEDQEDSENYVLHWVRFGDGRRFLFADYEFSVVNTPPLCPGVVCRCDEDVNFCPMHGRRRQVPAGWDHL
jgi:hypothetical protein